MPVELSEYERAALVDLVSNALAANPGQRAKELSRALGLDKTVVNHLLYAHTDRFAQIGLAGSAPLWALSGTPAAADVVPQERVTRPRVVIEEPAGDVEELEDLFNEALFDPTLAAKFVKRPTEAAPARSTPVATATNPLALYRWQEEALAAWRANGRRGIVDAVTGAGKTRLAIAAIAAQFNAGGKTLVLVPTVVLLHQWRDVVATALPTARVGLVGDGHDDTFRYVDVIISVLASARNRRFDLDGADGLLVADECHRAGAEKSQVALDPNFDARLGLSATHERLDEAHETILLPYFEDVVYQLDYRRAIADGVIANVRVAFVGVEFSDDEKEQYELLVGTLSRARRKLITHYGCRPQPFSLFLEDVIRLTRKGAREEGMAAQRWLKAWGDKKALLAETPAKQASLGLLIPAMHDADRTLIFTQSIKSATAIRDELATSGVSIATHHSEIDSRERAGIMASFADGTTRVLATVQTLEEGVDVPDADLAVIVASTKQRRQMVQRMGRVMRTKSDGRDARFVILFVRGTDEDPRKGAHESFVDELVDVARASDIFIESDQRELRDFLRP